MAFDEGQPFEDIDALIFVHIGLPQFVSAFFEFPLVIPIPPRWGSRYLTLRSRWQLVKTLAAIDRASPPRNCQTNSRPLASRRKRLVNPRHRQPWSKPSADHVNRIADHRRPEAMASRRHRRHRLPRVGLGAVGFVLVERAPAALAPEHEDPAIEHGCRDAV